MEFPILDTIAFLVKCPLHGDRFNWGDARPQIYVAKWLREKMHRLIWSRSTSLAIFSKLPEQVSEQYRKAYLASFPPDLWPTEEEKEEGEDGPKIYLRLKDGTRFQAFENHFSKPFGKNGDDQSRPEAASVECPGSNLEKDSIWQAETVRTVGRLLSKIGLLVDPIAFS
jgi:hypothetical protein